MNGGKVRTSGAAVATNGDGVHVGLEKTSAAWERFVNGADSVQGVRPEILMSWYRCREQYHVDPGLERAPDAEVSAHSPQHDVVFTELGGLASSVAAEVDGLDSVVTVADPEGHVLASWGSHQMLHLAADSNLAPWSTWSEPASGTNGMGTALESHHPVLVRGPEHWCRGFHQWVCAGVAVRDVVTDQPLAVLNISCWKETLPDSVLPWLRKATATTETRLRQRERHRGTLLATAFADARVPPETPLAAVDTAGHVVLANAEAAVLMETPADAVAYAPGNRTIPHIPALPRLVRRAVESARRDPEWRGSTQVLVPFLGTPVPIVVSPVRSGDQVIGLLLAFGSAEGKYPFGVQGADELTAPAASRALPSRVIAMREDRWVLLDPREIRYAETEHNTIWLVTDRGRLRAATRGLDRLEQQLESKGFLRVHRRFVVNLARIREIEQGFKGTLFLATDARGHETVPVSRRHIPSLRNAVGI